MSSLLYPITPQSKTDLCVDLITTIAGPFATTELRFPNAKTPVWPLGKRSLDDHGIRISGVPMKGAQSYTIGKQVVEFSVGLNPSVQAAAWLLAGLCQNKDWVTTKYTIVTPTVKEAKWFSALISGSDEASSELGLWKTLGCLPKAVKIGIPAAGPDGGEVTMSADMIGTVFAQVSPVTLTGGTLDAGVPILSTDCSFTLDATAAKVCSANINATNGAQPDPNINTVAAGPDSIILGEYTQTGDLSLIVEPDTTSHYYAIVNGLAAKTAHALIINVGASIVFTKNVVFGYPDGEPKEQNGVYIQTFPWRALYGSATDPKIEITMANLLATWA